MSKIEYNPKIIKETSENISIPFSEVEFRENGDFFKSWTLYSTLLKYFKKSGFSNTLYSDKILEQKTFKDNTETIVDSIYNLLKIDLEKRGKRISDISEKGIVDGVLIFKLESGEKIYFDLSAKNLNNLLVKQELKDVKESVENNISSYIIGGTVFSIVFEPIISHEAKRVSKGVKKVKKIVWKYKGKSFSVSTNVEIPKNINEKDFLKILEKQGIVYNIDSGEFVLKKVINSVKPSNLYEGILKLSYEKWNKKIEKAGYKNISESEFNKLKKEAGEFVKKSVKEYKFKKSNQTFGEFFKEKLINGIKEKVTLKNVKSSLSMSLEIILMPVFFQEIHKHSGSNQSYIESGTEILSFFSGAKASSFLLNKIGLKHPLVMLLGSLLGGGVSLIIGEETLKHFNKELLEKFTNKDIENGTKSVDGHILSMGTIYDFFDEIDFDFNDYLDMNNNINISTSPEYYLAKRFSGIKHWNKELNQYKEKTKIKIDDFLNKNYKYSDILKNKDDLSELLISIIVGKEVGSSKRNTEKTSKPKIEKILSFLEKNLDKNLYCGNEVEYKKFEKKLKIFLKTVLKDDKIINNILNNFQFKSEERFLKNIEEITGTNKYLINNLGNSGQEENFINNIQKKSLKKLDKFLLREYSRYKKDNKKSLKNGENKKNFIKNFSLNLIDRNKIDKNYIENYKENIKDKKILLNLAFEGRLSTKKDEKGKNMIISDGKISYIQIDNEKGKIIKSEENISDILYINSLNKEDRKFIKEDIYNKIIKGENIISNKIKNKELIKTKFDELLKNTKFYYFYKRMLILSKQNFFIKNIEKNGDAVEFDTKNSKILSIIGTVSDTVKYIFSTKTIKEVIK